MGAELDHLSTQTGVAVDDLMRIQQAYKDNGKDAGSAAKDINKMQKAIELASQDLGSESDPFAKLGLSAKELLAMNPTHQFYAIGAAIKSIQNPATRTARAMEIFGKSGGGLITVFQGSNLDDINLSLGKMPEIMKEFSAEMERADTLMGRFPNKSNQFFTGFTAGVIGSIIPSLEMINEQDFTQLGLNLGKSLANGLAPIGNFFKNISNDITVLSLAASDKFSGADFMDSARMYYAAMDKVDADAEERRKAEAAEDAYEKARMFEYANSPDYVDPASVISAKAATAPKLRSFSAPEFSDYQRRGLSLSESPSANLEKKTLDVMMQVRDILSRIERSPQAATF
jgi:hypothetical protein